MRALILTLFLYPAALSQAQSNPSAMELVNRGTALMSRNKVDAAIESYTKAIELKPAYAEAYVRRGMARRAKGDLAGSIEDYEKAASLDPKSTAGNRFVAESYSNRGYNRLGALDVEGAVKDFTRAIEIYPKEADHYFKRGRARIIKEDLDGAVSDLDRALGLSERRNTSLRTLIHANRGMARLLQGKEADAQRDFGESIRLNEGGKLMLDAHLRDLEVQIMLMRRLKAEQQKSIT